MGLTRDERAEIARQLDEIWRELDELTASTRERISRVAAAIEAPVSHRRPSPGQ